jgi:hypothetical protein
VDPDFKKKLFEDGQQGERRLTDTLMESIGLTMGHLWTLVHMHVGAPCRMKDLDALAKAFDRRNGGIYKIYNILASPRTNVCDMAWVKKKQKRQADAILKEVLMYNECMAGDKWNLPSMKLLYLGIENSVLLWATGSEVPADVWGDADSSLEDLGIISMERDVDIDKVRCTTCKKGEGKKQHLLACTCKCVQ